MKKVTLIGSGNLATRLSLSMSATGQFAFQQVYSHTPAHASDLANRLQCTWTTDAKAIRPGADLYIFALKDTALENIAAQVPANNGLWIHTAGSMPMEVFRPYASRYGVLYPLQTFSKQREVNFRQISLFLESNSTESAALLQEVASLLSDNVRFLSSEKRKNLHLAAVFACNFTNHLYALAGEILEEAGIPFDVLLPLIDETAAKVHDLSPRRAQTGPAVRYDENVIGKQLAMLTDAQTREIYRLLSQSIHQKSQES